VHLRTSSRVLVAALVASLILHLLALFSPELSIFPTVSEPQAQPLQARLVAAPEPLKPPKAIPKKKAPPQVPQAPSSKSQAQPEAPVLAVDRPSNVNTPDLPVPAESTGPAPGVAAASEEPVAEPSVQGEPFPPRGEIVYKVFRGDKGLEVGRAIHRWEVAEGRYRLYSLTETSGLIALFRSVSLEAESEGRIGPRGLQPERYRVRHDGKEGDEGAVFDWESHQVKIGNRPPVALVPGSQDLLSLHYHLAYLRGLEFGAAFYVATGKKYERYAFDSLGEEELDLPAGHFRVLHLQALSTTRTELWLALDHLLLPVKVRHTDKKGDVYEQVASVVNLPPAESP